MGGNLLFGQEGVVQVRGAHDFLKYFLDEIELYRDTRRLMDVLLGWTPRAKTMDEQFLELCVLMSKREFWSEDAFCEAWVSDLKLVGYAFPPVVEYRQPSKDVQASEKRNSATKTNDTCGDAQLGFQEWTGVHDAVAAAHPITRSTTAAPELGNTHELIERFGSQPLREADAKRAQDATDGSVLDAALGARDLDEDIRPPDDVLQMTEDDVFAQPSQIKLLVMINHGKTINSGSETNCVDGICRFSTRSRSLVARMNALRGSTEAMRPAEQCSSASQTPRAQSQSHRLYRHPRTRHKVVLSDS